MKCQILFSGKIKKNKKQKNINLSSAEFAQGVVKVKKIDLITYNVHPAKNNISLCI